MATVQTGKATDFITFSRASLATVTDSDGKIKWAPHNLLKNSESFDAASYITVGLLAFGSGSSANSAAAPNGTTTAEYLRETNTNSRHFIFAIPSTVAGANYTARVFVKAGERTFVALGIRTTDGVTGYAAVFNLSTGAMTATSTTGSPTNVSAPTPVAIGSGWYLLSVSMDATTSQAYVEIGLSDSATPTFAAGMPTYTGTGTSGLYLWGAHLYRSDLGGMQANTSAYPMYNPTTPKNLLGYTESLTTGWTGTNGSLQGNGLELVTNGEFASDTVWTKDTGWTITGGKAVASSATSSAGIYQSASVVAGKIYRITYTVSNYSAGQVIAYVGSSGFGPARSSNGTFTDVITCSGTAQIALRGFSNFSGEIDNVSVQEVSIYDAPNSLLTARAFEATAANGTLLGSVSLLASPYTFSIWLKRKAGSGNVQLTVDGSTYATVSVTDTWTRFSTTLTPSAGTKTPGIRLVTSGDAVYAWGAQLSASASLDSYVPSYGTAVTSAAYYGPRRDFDSAGVCKGLLVEEQRTNLLLRSAEFDNADWLKFLNAATVTANAAVSPDGTSSAEKLIASTTSSNQLIRQQLTIVAGTVYTFTVFGKKAEYDRLSLTAWDNVAGVFASALFNLTNGTALTGTAGNGGNGGISNFSSTITTVGNGWYRCAITFSLTSTTGNVYIGVYNADTFGNGLPAQYAGTGTSGLLIYGAQLEPGSFATSYIPTTSASVTRSADVASVSTQAFPYNQNTGSLVFSFGALNFSGSIAGASPYDTAIGVVTDGARQGRQFSAFNSSGWRIRTNTGTPASGTAISGSGSLAPSNGPAVAHKLGIAISASEFAGVVNGGTVTTGAITSAPTGEANLLYINNLINGYIRQITYLPRRLSNAELQARTL